MRVQLSQLLDAFTHHALHGRAASGRCVDVNQHLLACGRRLLCEFSPDHMKEMEALLVCREDLRRHHDAVAGVQLPQMRQVSFERVETPTSAVFVADSQMAQQVLGATTTELEEASFREVAVEVQPSSR